MENQEPKYETHPSYGVIVLSKASGNRHPLFGSSIIHNQFITLEIKKAKIKRDLNTDWITSTSEVPIVEVEMSYTQFAEAISSFGQGSGVPCTISYMDKKHMPECPFESKMRVFDKEFEDKMAKLASETNPAFTQIAKILEKPSIGKKDKEAITEQLRQLKQEIASNIPYVKKQFTEQIDKTVLEAKGEIEAFVESKIRSIGMEGFKKELMKLSDADSTLAIEGKGNE